MVWDWSNKWWSSWMSQREILPYQEPSDVTVHLYSVHEPFCQFNFSCSLENDSNPSIPIALWHHCTIVQCAMHTVHGPYRLFNFSSFLANDAKWEILPYQEPPVVTVHLCMNPFAYSICHLFCGKSSHTKSLLSSLDPFIYSTSHLFWRMTQSHNSNVWHIIFTQSHVIWRSPHKTKT